MSQALPTELNVSAISATTIKPYTLRIVMPPREPVPGIVLYLQRVGLGKTGLCCAQNKKSLPGGKSFGYIREKSRVCDEKERMRTWTDKHKIGQVNCNVKVRDIIDILIADGWSQIAQRGSHRQFKHPDRQGKVTVPGHMSDDLSPGTLKSILRQSGLEERR
jgi:predicted RNA binding protein YcfA (HicA-like mRNA interferase family)